MKPMSLSAAVAASGFVALAVVVGVMKAPMPGDEAVLRAVQEPGWLLPIAEAVNLAGDYQYVTLGVVFMAALGVGRSSGSIRRRGIVGGFLLAALFLSVDQEIKAIVDSPRPAPGEGIEVHDTSDTGGFPSGHTFTVTLCAGLLAVLAARATGRPDAWLAFALVLSLVGGLARVIVGAHWPSDVLGGWLLGAAAIGACALAARLGDSATARSKTAGLPRNAGRNRGQQPPTTPRE